VAFAAPPCPNGAYLEGRGEGASVEEARDKANTAISKSIFSSVSSVTLDSLFQKETADDFEEHSKRTRSSKVETAFRHAQYVKDKDGYPKKEGGVFVSERYICKADAAKPYLDSLRYLIGVLAEKSCDNLNETLKSIAGLENIIVPLGQMNESLKSEYRRVQEECGQMGLYLEVKESILGAKSRLVREGLEELLSRSGCKTEPKARGGGFTLKVDAKDCCYKKSDFHYCGSEAKVELIDGRNKKGGFKASLKENAGWTSKKEACEAAAKDVVPRIWEEIKGRIKEVCE
jgi:hypothetical protein